MTLYVPDGQPFPTQDRDNDNWGTETCASSFHAEPGGTTRVTNLT